MQTALQRRQRHRRNGAARRGRGGGAARRAALAIPLLLFSSFLVFGGVGFVAAVSAYAHYSEGLKDPTEGLESIPFEQPSIVYDRTGKIELARFGVLRREIVAFEDIPLEMIDATTSVEDKDFWTNPGFDMGAVISAGLDTLAGRPRGASTITQQLVRARLLPADAFEGSVYDRKIREIIQSIRLTQAYPGQDGKRKIMAAYLNQNFYGNQSYGVKAAAFGYFGKDLDELSLAQYAVLAAIPQSPTRYDLMRNAVRECEVEIEEGAKCPEDKVRLIVPDTDDTDDIISRRNFVLEQMKTRSVLSGDTHTVDEYERAKDEPLILTPQASPPMKAPHFVWQIRKQLGALLCGEEFAETCEAVDTGGYKVITTLDWEKQQTVEKWLYASTRVTHLKDPTPVWKEIGIPKAELGWLRALRGSNIHNGAAAVMDYKTGEILAYGGSGGYYLDGNKKFQPQYDVLSVGYRQLGSAIKPLNYIVGIDDHSLTAASMFMDVVTDFGAKGSGSFFPTQADGLERGPMRLRPALQMSFNIPSIKAGLEVGLEREYNRWKEFGLTYPPGKQAVVSQSVGSLENHPIEMLGAYGAIANGGVLMPRTMILEVKDNAGATLFPTGEPEVGSRVASPQAAYIVTDILAGNTVKSINPLWGAWQIIDKSGNDSIRRPAAYKTGTTNDRKDTAAFGYLAAPKNDDEPALAVGVWMGNSDNTPNNDALSLKSAAPLWSRIMTEVSQGLPIAKFTDHKPKNLVNVEVDAFSGLLPGPGTVKTVEEMFIKGTEPTRRDDLHVAVQIDSATGLLWNDGCTGPMQTKLYLDFSKAEPGFPQWQRYTQGWAQRAARGAGVRGGPKNTRTMYFYNLSFHPFGATWGGKFKPTEVCSALQPCPPFVEGSPAPSIGPCVTPEPTPTESHGNGPPTKEPGPTPTDPGPKPTRTPRPSIQATGLAEFLQAGIPPAAAFPLLVPLVGLVLGRKLRPARPPSRRHRPRRARPPGPS
ncbi:MAG TPA: transglycosylase domain-containing protein [Candidatus Limnocylindrales bacterium]|nr:transglycosylase domain-containing protein [Candidatus Limnocylindrales bacterium]